MKKILILFFFICTSIAFAKYEDLYNVEIHTLENTKFKTCQYYEMVTKDSNKKYSSCILFKFAFNSNKEAEEFLKKIPDSYSAVEDIYEHKILGFSGYFIIKVKDPVSKNKNTYSYRGFFWYTNTLTTIYFSDYDEAQKFFKYLEVNNLLENTAQKMYTRLLLQKMYEDKFLSSLKK